MYYKYAEYAWNLPNNTMEKNEKHLKNIEKSMKNDETHVNALNNKWKIIKNILKIMEESLKNNELTSSK